MATIAYDSPDERPAKPPVSAHPAFPAIVALWFAALLGLGSLVLPPILLERFVAATGLASLVPAFAPPLGFTARGLLALAAALVGVGVGLSIARRVARGPMPEREDRAAKLTAGLRRPISVHDELGGEGVINGHGLPINRRRALAISEDERPSDFLYVAPLPGEDPFATPAPCEEPAAAAAIEEEPLELSEIASEAAPEDFAEPAEAEEEDEMTEKQEFQPVSPFATFDEPEPEVVEELDARKNAAGRRGLEPLPFSAPSLARRAPRQSLEVTMALPEPQPRQEFVPAEPAAFEPAPEPEPEAESLRSDWQTAPTESLGLVQLVQRLGATIEKRREWVTAGAAAAPIAPAPAPLSGVEAAPAEEAAEGLAAFFGSAATLPDMAAGADEEPAAEFAQSEPIADEAPAPRPAFLRGVADDDDDADADDELPDFSLPLDRAVPAQLADDEPTDEGGQDETEEPAEDDGFTSLLDMRNPFEAAAPEFVRIEEPEPDADDAEPAVVFPSAAAAQPVAEFGSAPPSRRFDPPGKAAPSFGASQSAPGDADAALRAALATLQRMSGAA